MSKEELDNNSNNIENTSNKVETKKNLCVHELRKRLKNKQRKENINKVAILLITTFFIIFLSVIIY